MHFSRNALRLSALYSVSALGAVALALALAGTHAEGRAAGAATHCTHYTPIYSIDYNCWIHVDLDGGYTQHNKYSTTGFAKRDSNSFSSETSDGYWWLSYSDDGWTYPWAFGNGYGGTIAGTRGAYEGAWCSPWSPTAGNCTTNWHD